MKEETIKGIVKYKDNEWILEIDGFDVECGEFLDGIDNYISKGKLLEDGDEIELKIIRRK